MNWLDFLVVQGTLKSLRQHYSSKPSFFWHSAFFIVQLSHPYMTIGKTIALTTGTFVGKVMSLPFIYFFMDFENYTDNFIYLFLLLLFFYFTILYWFLPYINMNPPWVYTCSPSWTPLPPPSLYYPSGSSQCTSPKHPVSCIKPGLVIRFLYDIIHVSMPFSQIIPPSPSPTESKRLFCTFECLALLHAGLLLPSF